MSRLLEIQEQLLETHAALARLERVAARDPLARSVDLNRRSLDKRRKELEEAFLSEADLAGVDVCTYRLFGEHTRPTAWNVASTLKSFQNMVTVVYNCIVHGPRERQRVSPDVWIDTAFEFGYSFAGSVGLVLTLSNERLIAIESDIDETIKSIFEITEARSPEELIEFSKQFGLAAIRATYGWTKDHVEGGLGTAIDWQRGHDVRLHSFIQLQRLVQLKEAIERTSDEKATTFHADGVLLGADDHPKRFHFKPDRGKEIRGSFDDAISPSHPPQLYRRYRATVQKVTVKHFSLDKDEDSFHLLNLDEIGPRRTNEEREENATEHE